VERRYWTWEICAGQRLRPGQLARELGGGDQRQISQQLVELRAGPAAERLTQLWHTQQQDPATRAAALQPARLAAGDLRQLRPACDLTPLGLPGRPVDPVAGDLPPVHVKSSYDAHRDHHRVPPTWLQHDHPCRSRRGSLHIASLAAASAGTAYGGSPSPPWLPPTVICGDEDMPRRQGRQRGQEADPLDLLDEQVHGLGRPVRAALGGMEGGLRSMRGLKRTAAPRSSPRAANRPDATRPAWHGWYPDGPWFLGSSLRP
jgi:hypothetical protein